LVGALLHLCCVWRVAAECLPLPPPVLLQMPCGARSFCCSCRHWPAPRHLATSDGRQTWRMAFAVTCRCCWSAAGSTRQASCTGYSQMLFCRHSGTASRRRQRQMPICCCGVALWTAAVPSWVQALVHTSGWAVANYEITVNELRVRVEVNGMRRGTLSRWTRPFFKDARHVSARMPHSHSQPLLMSAVSHTRLSLAATAEERLVARARVSTTFQGLVTAPSRSPLERLGVCESVIHDASKVFETAGRAFGGGRTNGAHIFGRPHLLGASP
jgi:hypothetical protein